jgi:hypothetical protein
MRSERPFPPPRFLALLWIGWWLALAWLAGMALHHEPVPALQPATAVAAEKVAPQRPAFEEMQTFIAESRPITVERWSAWLDQSQQALSAARSWGSANYLAKELESNLQLLSAEIRKQLLAAGDEAVLNGVLFRLSRSNPQLRLYEQERLELERAPADLSRLLLRLFTIVLASESLEPNVQALELACPVWGELSQALTQLQKELETSKGRRLDLVRRSLSVFEKPDLTTAIHAHAQQCATVVESRKAVATLARALQQVAWAKVFVTAVPAAALDDKPARTSEPSGHLLASQWLPSALILALVCSLLLAWSLRMRSQRLAQQWDLLLQQRQALQSQVHQLHAQVARYIEEASAVTALPASSPPPDAQLATQAVAVVEPLTRASPGTTSSPAAAGLSRLKSALAAANEQLRNTQLGLIRGADKNQVLQELEYIQALLDASWEPAGQDSGAQA